MFSEVAICTVDICQFFSALTMTLRNDPLLQERGRAEAIICVAIAVVLVGPVVCCDSGRVAVAYRTVSLVLLFCCSCCFSILSLFNFPLRSPWLKLCIRHIGWPCSFCSSFSRHFTAKNMGRPTRHSCFLPRVLNLLARCLPKLQRSPQGRHITIAAQKRFGCMPGVPGNIGMSAQASGRPSANLGAQA